METFYPLEMLSVARPGTAMHKKALFSVFRLASGALRSLAQRKRGRRQWKEASYPSTLGLPQVPGSSAVPSICSWPSPKEISPHKILLRDHSAKRP